MRMIRLPVRSVRSKNSTVVVNFMSKRCHGHGPLTGDVARSQEEEEDEEEEEVFT